ncbi:MAG TPA: pantoate--beta-alanine ligase [Gemmatimonas sp.]|nr:pantoate--beta-alanine ligase [Gemmatimonas sp.]
MQVVQTVSEVRLLVAGARRAGQRVALIPTMGALHEGHLSLVRAARRDGVLVVVSLFVNPTQFNEARDLAAYPRDEVRDGEVAQAAGCDVLFVPLATEMYPAGFGTYIDVGPIALPLEGESRGPLHFRGVATVVCKLFNIVQPDAAYFGQKDAQQTLVIRQLARDLNIPVELHIEPTVRESSGLALSSRNRRLTDVGRAKALGLVEALRAVEERFEAGEREAQALEAVGRAALAARELAGKDVEYLTVSDYDTLGRVRRIEGRVLVSMAVLVDGVRLIDNVVLTP